MAKRVVWSENAKNSRREFLDRHYFFNFEYILDSKL